MIITIGGVPGSGKSSVGLRLSKKLDCPYFDVGDMRRVVASKRGMTIEQFNEWAKKNPKEGDLEFEKFVQSEVAKVKNAIVAGRVAYWAFPKSFKVYLAVDLTVGAKRILSENKEKNVRREDYAKNVVEKVKLIQDRIAFEKVQYKKLYHTDCHDYKNFDLVVDTTNIPIPEVVKQVLDGLKKAQTA